MKTRSIFFPALILLTTILTQCKKPDDCQPVKTFKAHSWTSLNKEELTLYVDGQIKGTLPYFKSDPGCGDYEDEQQKPLLFELKSGQHRIMAKDIKGNIISDGTININKNSIRSSGGIGGQIVNSKENCLGIGIF